MKKKKTNTILVFSTMVFSLVLMSNSPSSKTETSKDLNGEGSLHETMELVFKDPIFKSLMKEDVKHLFFITNSPLNPKYNWADLSRKKNLSNSETDFILSSIGFSSQFDFISYMDKILLLSKKYDILNQDIATQNFFFKSLRAKQSSSEEYKQLFQKNFISANFGSGGVRPECWKCAYDYRDCMTPQVSSLTYTTAVGVEVPGTLQITFMIGNTIVSQALFPVFINPEPAKVTYVNPAYQASFCMNMYKTCVSQCNNP